MSLFFSDLPSESKVEEVPTRVLRESKKNSLLGGYKGSTEMIEPRLPKSTTLEMVVLG